MLTCSVDGDTPLAASRAAGGPQRSERPKPGSIPGIDSQFESGRVDLNSVLTRSERCLVMEMIEQF